MGLGEEKKFAIFGAGMAATTVAGAVFVLYKVKPVCFVVTDTEKNPHEIMGRRVISLAEYAETASAQLLLVAIPDTGQEEIALTCKRMNIPCFCITSRVKNRLLYTYYDSGRDMPFRVMRQTEGRKDGLALQDKMAVYMACGPNDRQLKGRYELAPYIFPVQAGAALREDSSLRLRDDRGRNISEQNFLYSELTVLYWAWRNVHKEYIGLCHYRRIFDLDSGAMETAIRSETDAILPYPSIQYPDASTHEKRYVNPEIREVIRAVVKERLPEEYGCFEETMSKPYLYNFNMLIARKKVLDSYCEWLFFLLGEIEAECRRRGLPVEKRQAGYWGEILMTLYFMNRDRKLNILHTGVQMLV